MSQTPKTGRTGKKIVSGGTVVRHPKSKSPGGHNGASASSSKMNPKLMH